MSKFNTNTNSFLAAANALPVGDLARCYCRLVAIELCLKANCSTTNGHDIETLLNSCLSTVPISSTPVAGESVSPTASGVANSLITRLKNEIRNIWVTSASGGVERARAQAYPDIRYARFSTDLWTPPEKNISFAHVNALDSATMAVLNFIRVELAYPI